MNALYLISQHRKRRKMQSVCGISHRTTTQAYFQPCLLVPLLSAHGRLLPGRGCHPVIHLTYEMSRVKASRVIPIILIYCSAKGALLCSPASRLCSLWAAPWPFSDGVNGNWSLLDWRIPTEGWEGGKQVEPFGREMNHPLLLSRLNPHKPACSTCALKFTEHSTSFPAENQNFPILLMFFVY